MGAFNASKVNITFEDGSKCEVSAEKLSLNTKNELSSFHPGIIGSADAGFLLFEWKDGWREVLRVESDMAEVQKYYVIERLEQVGRLILKRSGFDYPELVEVTRKPKELIKVTVI